MTAKDVTWPHVTGREPEETSFHRKSPGSGCRKSKTRVLCTFEHLQGCNLQEVVVTWQEMMSRDLPLPEVSQKCRAFTGSYLEVTVKGQKLGFCVRLSSCRAVTHKRWPSRHRKWCHVTSRDRKWAGRDVIFSEVTWKWL